MSDTLIVSSPQTSTQNSSPNTTPRAGDAAAFPSSSSASSSPRLNSMRRKPIPVDAERSADEDNTVVSHDGDETLVNTSQVGMGEGSKGEKGGATTATTSGVGGARESSESSNLHSFPPKASTAISSTSHTSPPFSYGSTNPTTMSASAYQSPVPSSPPYAGGLTSRPSIHSHRTSIAPESVFGSAPTGVIGKTKPREIVRVERDYSAGETCQFWSGWIWELEGRVSPTDFQNTLNELNTVLASAHDPYRSCFDNCLAVLTFYLSPRLISSHYAREMKTFDRILERANREIYNPAGLNILSPRRNAFLFLEIEYY